MQSVEICNTIVKESEAYYMIVNSEELKRLRQENGLTLKDVAMRLDITEATVSRYESGQIKRISPKIILGYSKLFRVPINSLYENAETEWVQALEEAGLHDPRVAGFIEYLEEQAQKDTTESIALTDEEAQLILAYRQADNRTRQIVNLTLNAPHSKIEAEIHFPLSRNNKEGDSDAPK